MRKTIAYRISALAIAMIFAGLSGAGAQPLPNAPDPANGQRLAKRFCSSCHLTGDPTQTSAQPGVPSFKSIANQTDMTTRYIRNSVIYPHPPMVNTNMTNDEIRDLSAYIFTLKDKK